MWSRSSSLIINMPLLSWALQGRALPSGLDLLGQSALSGGGSSQSTSLLNSALTMQSNLKQRKEILQLLQDREASRAILEKLQGRVVNLQNELAELDATTFSNREQLVLEAQQQQLALATGIDVVAKLLRAVYDQTYPARTNKPILIVPHRSFDDIVLRAEQFRRADLEKYLAGDESICGKHASLMYRIQALGGLSAQNEFDQFAEMIFNLPAEDRLAEDILHEAFYARKVSRLEKRLADLKADDEAALIAESRGQLKAVNGSEQANSTT